MINNPSKGQEIPEMGSGRFPDGGYFFCPGRAKKSSTRAVAKPGLHSSSSDRRAAEKLKR